MFIQSVQGGSSSACIKLRIGVGGDWVPEAYSAKGKKVWVSLGSFYVMVVARESSSSPN